MFVWDDFSRLHLSKKQEQNVIEDAMKNRIGVGCNGKMNIFSAVPSHKTN
jgi:hypothetical protein